MSHQTQCDSVNDDNIHKHAHGVLNYSMIQSHDPAAPRLICRVVPNLSRRTMQCTCTKHNICKLSQSTCGITKSKENSPRLYTNTLQPQPRMKGAHGGTPTQATGSNHTRSQVHPAVKCDIDIRQHAKTHTYGLSRLTCEAGMPDTPRPRHTPHMEVQIFNCIT